MLRKTWNKARIYDWLSLLGSSPERQQTIVRDLLAHATSDGMTARDRTLCRVALKLLEVEHGLAPVMLRQRGRPKGPVIQSCKDPDATTSAETTFGLSSV